MNFKQSIIGSSIAFLLATSCCWLPWVLIAIGGTIGIAGFSETLEKFSGLFFVVGLGSLGWGAFQFYKRKNTTMNLKNVQLKSTITCPECGHQKEEQMPTDACQFFYECKNCKKVLKPNQGDCCVYCSYGTVACPPIQLNQDCC